MMYQRANDTVKTVWDIKTLYYFKYKNWSILSIIAPAAQIHDKKKLAASIASEQLSNQIKKKGLSH